MKKSKIAIAAGGSGGHLFPAQALAQRLVKTDPPSEIFFMAGGLATNKYFDRESFRYFDISCRGGSFRHPLKLLRSSFSILQGVSQSYKILRKEKPDLLIGFGSYHVFPVLLAATLVGIPFILHAADSIPGKVIRLFSPFAQFTGVHFPEASKYLKGKSLEVPLPLREGYQLSHITKEEARQSFQLNPSQFTILVFGGSQGAKNLNVIISESLKEHSKQETPFQVIHFTGNPEMADELQREYGKQGIKAHVSAFGHQMNRAWAAADLSITRSGASSIAEQMEFEVPGILIPYPYAKDNHQEHNAKFLAEKVGGGFVLLEKSLTSAKLAEEISRLQKKKREMTEAMSAYKGKSTRKSLVNLVTEYIQNGAFNV